MNFKKIICCFFIIVFCIGFNTSCSTKINEEPVTKETVALDTIISLKYYGKNANEAINESMKKISNIENEMSIFLPNSEISQINKSSGENSVKVNSDVMYVSKKAYEHAKLSNGAFDPTVEPITDLWGVGTNHQKVPTESEIKKTRSLINYNDIIIDEKNSTIKLRREGQGMDFGGIAKGYCADELKKICEKYNIKSAIIDLGGNVYDVGDQPNGKPWNTGVQDPLGDNGEFIGIITNTDKSVVSAGDYERFFVKDRKNYGQIFDPLTGCPANNGVIATTIVSDYSIDGDALSNSLFVLGVNKGLNLIKSFKRIDALCITSDKKIYLTPGMKKIFKVTNTKYKIAN
ncbi:thiamine biosynthesis lipoprotein [Clostridium algifaecis]|uniref:FAD:protein FMN transferase n=1 Tax=Clostridium algifaecis TaxID=1472040 RepID=A0ABS4KU86_9CLOT|nr:FAD:protein FMN transferase [Clostridium algifaecis]MBP2033614.1 thiamine biosynthesis lipoprotein [Clostridium algifaecis]